MEKYQQLDALKSEIIRDNPCPALEAQATQLIMGDGNPDADFLFIGEAPGKKEDETGLPFQGAAGKRLNELLDASDLERKDVYITNLVKYRPPNNRDPKNEEKQAFWPYLERELEIVNPKVILTLGRHSMSHFLPDATIGDVHGQLHDVTVGGKNYTVAPLYHPAATLFNRRLLPEYMADLPKVIDQLSSSKN